jgi:hypothetical protein
MENGAQIDASGDLDGVKFSDAATLGKVLHDNPAITSCLVNRLYSYAAGRQAEKGEVEWMKFLNANFATNGYRLPDLMRTIVTSDAFYRISSSETASISSKESAQ